MAPRDCAGRVFRLGWMSGLPKRFEGRVEIAAVRAEAEALEPGGEARAKRRVAGRVLARRDMGKLVFLDLVDRSGRIQVLCPVERTGELELHLGDIVGSAEANPAENKLSNESPVGKAIMGKKKGETVEVAAPRGKLTFKIMDIKAA